MSKVLLRLSLLFKLMSVLGIIGGLRLTIQILAGKGTFPVNVPGYPHPIFIRKGTADAAVLHDILIDEEYKSINYKEQPGTIVDAGGNIGLTSLYFARKYPSAKILTIEPDKSNFEVMARNLAPYPNIEIMHAAVWPHQTSLRIANPQETPDNYVFRPTVEIEGEEIPTITVPEILERMGGSIDLFKIDIEGSEHEIFTTADLDWLKSVKAITIEIHDRIAPGTSKAIYSALADYDYNQFFGAKPIYILKE